jgi:hypothetical protein
MTISACQHLPYQSWPAGRWTGAERLPGKLHEVADVHDAGGDHVPRGVSRVHPCRCVASALCPR